MGFVAICHRCSRPTFLDLTTKTQHPGVPFGGSVRGISDENVLKLYDEARNAMAVNAYTAVVLACRKLLMHVAVAKGAKEGLTFIEYVDHLADAGWVPPNGRGWVDHIRRRSNEANHEIRLMSKQDAEDLVTFSEMLLKFVYEFPQRVPTTP